MNVLFVCTGNTCRSPMAEHIFKKMLSDAGRKDVSVTSAGTSPTAGLEFPPEAQRALAKEGVATIAHRARGLTRELVKDADVILTMESRHKNAVVERYPEANGKVFVLNAYAGLGRDHDGIEDPFGGPFEAYAAALSKIKKALTVVFEKLKES